MITVVYSEKQVADPGPQKDLISEGYVPSPSARKPKELYELLLKHQEELGLNFVAPEPVTIDDIKRCHDAKYVDGVLNLTEENGFGTISQSVCDSLPYTNGAMFTAARLATANNPTCALVSGFHHAMRAGWKGHGYFCTWNGLMIAAEKLIAEGLAKKVYIVDADMHWGNGTDDILRTSPYRGQIGHSTFGKFYKYPGHAEAYLEKLQMNGSIYGVLERSRPEVILYQAGADVHVDDPYGGVLNTNQIIERDRRMFNIAKTLEIPIAWNLAGGYQVEADGSIGKVLDLHLNTFKAAKEVYGDDSVA